METRTTNSLLRTNFFFSDPSQNITLTFDQEKLSATIIKGNSYGIYYVMVTPTKAQDLTFSVAINGVKLSIALPTLKVYPNTIKSVQLCDSQSNLVSAIPITTAD